MATAHDIRLAGLIYQNAVETFAAKIAIVAAEAKTMNFNADDATLPKQEDLAKAISSVRNVGPLFVEKTAAVKAVLAAPKK
jgi:hypothetical protein